MSSGSKRGGSKLVEGVKPIPREFGVTREFVCATYLPAERHLRVFLEEVAYKADLQLSYRAQWLLARFWKSILPMAAARLTVAMRKDIGSWVSGSSVNARVRPPEDSPGRGARTRAAVSGVPATHTAAPSPRSRRPTGNEPSRH